MIKGNIARILRIAYACSCLTFPCFADLFSMTVCIGTYDVQNVSLTDVGSGSVRLECFFVVNSEALGCQLTLCKQEAGGQAFSLLCQEVHLSQDTPSQVLGGLVGVYMITRVADMEEDGNLNVMDDLTPLYLQEVSVTEGPLVTSSSPEIG